MSSIYRTALPLASLTAVGMLATDFYLPAVPDLALSLHGTLTQSQATLAVFMAALAISQLLWGWAADRFGEGRMILLGSALLCGASILCALAPNIEWLLFGRAVQGLGAGAATVVVPALLRKRSNEEDAVKSIALVGMAESVIPALGPVAGALVIAHVSWRWTFWIVAALTLLLAPVVGRLVSLQAPAANADAAGSYMSVLRNRVFMRLALSYACMFGALLMFVSSAPELVTGWLRISVNGFAILQIFGVGAFMLGAAGGGRLVRRCGTPFLITAGIWVQGVACVCFLLLALLDVRVLNWVIVGWVVFCLGLGIRAPATMARALTISHQQAGKASGLLMFLAFSFSSGATMLVAPWLHLGLMPLAIGLTLLVLASGWLVPPAKTDEPELP